MGFDFIVIAPPPIISLWLLLLTWGIVFWWVQLPPINGCSTASCSFGALAGGDERMSFLHHLELEARYFYYIITVQVARWWFF